MKVPDSEAERRMNTGNGLGDLSDETLELAALTALIARTGRPAEWPWAWIRTDGPIRKGTSEIRLALRTNLWTAEGQLRAADLTIPTTRLWRGWEEADGYQIELFGLLRRLAPDGLEHPLPAVAEPGGPLLQCHESEDAPPWLDIQLWYQHAARSKADPLIAGLRWRPGLTDPLDDYTPTQPADVTIPAKALSIAQNGLRILHRLAPALSRAGGPTAMSDTEALNEAVQLGAQWLDDHPDKSPSDLKSHHLAAQKVIAPKSYETWMTEKHFGIKAVRRKLIELGREK